jgi:hypothetical protein
MQSASSSRLGRKPQKRTLTLVQLPFLGLINRYFNTAANESQTDAGFLLIFLVVPLLRIPEAYRLDAF